MLCILGGHTAEMLQLVKSLDPKRYTPRIYMVANTDLLSKEKAIEYEQVRYDKYNRNK
jgi:beta-1,4-N-acetylglucosaminyltransferase